MAKYIFGRAEHDNKQFYLRCAIDEPTYMVFEMTQNDNCCGLIEMGQFSFLQNLNSKIKESLIAFFTDVKDNYLFEAYMDDESCIKITLVDYELVDLFTKCGFKTVHTFMNVKTANEVSIMVLDIASNYEMENEEDDDF